MFVQYTDYFSVQQFVHTWIGYTNIGLYFNGVLQPTFKKAFEKYLQYINVTIIFL